MSLSFESLVERIQDEATRRQAASADHGVDSRPFARGSGAPDGSAGSRATASGGTLGDRLSADDGSDTSSEPEFVIKDRYHLDDFLRYHGANFINFCYIAILGRAPDPDGTRFYLDSLNQVSLEKPEIVGRLRYSREGRARKVPIAGLKHVLAFQSFCRIPVLGYLTRLLITVVRMPSVLVQLKRVDNLALSEWDRLSDQHKVARSRIRELESYLLALEQHTAKERKEAAAVVATQQNDQELLRSSLSDLASGVSTQYNATQSVLEDLRSDHSTLKQATEAERRDAADELDKYKADLEQQGRSLTDLASSVSAQREANQAIIEGLRLTHLQLKQSVMEESSALAKSLGEQANKLDGQASTHRELADTLARHRETDQGAVDDLRSDLAELEKTVAGRQATRQEIEAFASIESELRGPASAIRDRLAIYLPELEVCRQHSAPAVDIGCGRGEWVGMIGDNGVRAIGVENDPVLAEAGRNRNLDIRLEDAFEFLEKSEADSLGLISIIHVIEHLPSSELLRFLLQANRCLIPGGTLIVETPNPENLRVGAFTFYCDPTHQKPIPPQLLELMANHCGFDNTRVERLHPLDTNLILSDAEEPLRTMSNMIYGPQDYAIIARKPIEP